MLQGMTNMRWSYPHYKAALSLTAWKLLRVILFTLFGLVYFAYCIICMSTCGFIHAASVFCPNLIAISVQQSYHSIFEFPVELVKNLELWSYITSQIKNNQVKRERLRFEPVPLQTRRKRRLSSSKTNAQLQSPLFQMLPLEIRQIIYKNVILGGFEHRHVIEWNAKIHKRERLKLWGRGCNKKRGSPITSCHPDCHAKVNPAIYRTQIKLNAEGTLGLAKTCRQMYLESINLYYSS